MHKKRGENSAFAGLFECTVAKSSIKNVFNALPLVETVVLLFDLHPFLLKKHTLSPHVYRVFSKGAKGQTKCLFNGVQRSGIGQTPCHKCDCSKLFKICSTPVLATCSTFLRGQNGGVFRTSYTALFISPIFRVEKSQVQRPYVSLRSTTIKAHHAR